MPLLIFLMQAQERLSWWPLQWIRWMSDKGSPGMELLCFQNIRGMPLLLSALMQPHKYLVVLLGVRLAKCCGKLMSFNRWSWICDTSLYKSSNFCQLSSWICWRQQRLSISELTLDGGWKILHWHLSFDEPEWLQCSRWWVTRIDGKHDLVYILSVFTPTAY